jgi:hypothetical protein
MSEQSAKPYLVRAICEWCADNGLTPYIAVKVDAATRVPLAFVKNGEIVLNVSTTATRRLTIDNESIQFNARFGGVLAGGLRSARRCIRRFCQGNGVWFCVCDDEGSGGGADRCDCTAGTGARVRFK